jgi:hypothetical protein
MLKLRYLLFVAAIVIGMAGGVFYSRVISPVELVDTSPETLSIDYKTDYVLIVAEAYFFENDPCLALFWLSKLGGEETEEKIDHALIFGNAVGYSPEDISLMNELEQALVTTNPNLEACGQ